jgi:thiol-disulfide isomerase/thioredoxin
MPLGRPHVPHFRGSMLFSGVFSGRLTFFYKRDTMARERKRRPEPPKTPMTKASYLGLIVAILILLGVLVGIGFFLVRVIYPMIPTYVVPHPEGCRGVGKPIQFLELEPLTDGASRLSLTDIQENVVLLNFWGTWCAPCRAELPHMAGLQQRFSGQKGFRLVAVSYPQVGQGHDRQSLRENTEALLKRLDIDLPIYWDPDERTLRALDQVVPFDGFPFTVLLGRHGVVRGVWVGYRPGVETEIERYVDQVLSEENAREANDDTK